MLVVDLSNVNGPVNFTALKEAGVKGVWAKATEGVTFNDGVFQAHRADAKKHGLHFGAYHFARPGNNSPQAEAEHFVNMVKKVNATDFKPVLDFETDAKVNLEKWARAFNGIVTKKLGVIPIFYSYPAFVGDMRLTRTIGNGLWLASYSKNDGTEHPFEIPAPWKHVVAHQFTSNWHVKDHNGPLDASHVVKVNAVLAHPIRAKVVAAFGGGRGARAA